MAREEDGWLAGWLIRICCQLCVPGRNVCQGNLHQHIRPIVFGFFRFGFGMEMDVEAKVEMEMDAEMEVGGTHHCVTIEA